MSVALVEIAMLIVSCINALSIIVLVYQAKLLKEQIVKTHEQARRDRTIEILSNWCQSISNVNGFVEKIENLLTEEQCRALYNRLAFTVSGQPKELICDFCKSEGLHACDQCDHASSLEVSKMLLSKIRWSMVSYLNSTETVALAWQEGIVQRDVIESEFDYLYNTQTGYTLLQKLRSCTHQGNAYPAIEALCNRIKEKHGIATPKKKPL